MMSCLILALTFTGLARLACGLTSVNGQKMNTLQKSVQVSVNGLVTSADSATLLEDDSDMTDEGLTEHSTWQSGTETNEAASGFIRWKAHPNKCLDVNNGHEDQKNGRNVQIWDCVNGEPNEQWTVPSSHGEIKWSTHPHKCLDINNGHTHNGANVQIWDCHWDENMIFYTPSSGTGEIRWAKHPNKCLDVNNGDTSNGNNLQMWDCGNGHPNQQWIVPTKATAQLPPGPKCVESDAKGVCSRCEDGTYLNGGECLDECPPGNTQHDEATGGRCEPCYGQIKKNKCKPCPNGHIAKPNSNKCQNIQDTCNVKQCKACLECVTAAEPHLANCMKDNFPDAECIDFNKHWCGKFHDQLTKCESFSYGCFYKLMCHSPQVCETWKAVRCGGSETNALLQGNVSVNSGEAALLKRRGQVHGMSEEANGLDLAVAGKCG